MALKILLADDSMIAQNMGKKILNDAGYEVTAVSNGAAAMKRFTELQPDIVLLDVYMPGYTGLEVCDKIKKAPSTFGVPVLLTVGKLEPFRPEDGMRVRADGVIVKPFEATDLIAVVNKLAERLPGGATPSPQPPTVIDEVAEPVVEEIQSTIEHTPLPSEFANAPAFAEDFLGSDSDWDTTPASAPIETVEASAPAEQPAGKHELDVQFAMELPQQPVADLGLELETFAAPAEPAVPVLPAKVQAAVAGFDISTATTAVQADATLPELEIELETAAPIIPEPGIEYGEPTPPEHPVPAIEGLEPTARDVPDVEVTVDPALIQDHTSPTAILSEAAPQTLLADAEPAAEELPEFALFNSVLGEGGDAQFESRITAAMEAFTPAQGEADSASGEVAADEASSSSLNLHLQSLLAGTPIVEPAEVAAAGASDDFAAVPVQAAELMPAAVTEEPPQLDELGNAADALFFSDASEVEAAVDTVEIALPATLGEEVVELPVDEAVVETVVEEYTAADETGLVADQAETPSIRLELIPDSAFEVTVESEAASSVVAPEPAEPETPALEAAVPVETPMEAAPSAEVPVPAETAPLAPIEMEVPVEPAGEPSPEAESPAETAEVTAETPELEIPLEVELNIAPESEAAAETPSFAVVPEPVAALEPVAAMEASDADEIPPALGEAVLELPAVLEDESELELETVAAEPTPAEPPAEVPEPTVAIVTPEITPALVAEALASEALAEGDDQAEAIVDRVLKRIRPELVAEVKRLLDN